MTYAQELSYELEMKEYRRKYYEAYVQSDRAPYLEQDTIRINFFDLDESYKVKAKLVLSTEASAFDMALYSGITRKFVEFGRLDFSIKGVYHSLFVYQDISRGNNPLTRQTLFLPFKDATNGETTYGGGRYLDLKLSDLDEAGFLILDFNKAYNPWCAYSDGYNCPIPPRANHLDIPIHVGERGWFKELDFSEYESN